MLYAFIPARFASTRFPGKPLAKILDKPMLEWVYTAVKESQLVDKVIILTDDKRIETTAKTFLNNRDAVVLTPSSLSSGTERIAYFLSKHKVEADKIKFVLNIQGDEPLIDVNIIDTLASLTKSCTDTVPMATLYTVSNSLEEFYDKNVVKLVIDNSGNAMYFSRAPIPNSKTEIRNISFLKHIGIYGYKKNFLTRYLILPKGNLEEQESLEQLRTLESGLKIKVAKVDKNLVGVDTQEDIKKVEKILKK